MALCYMCGMGVGEEAAYHPHAACLMFRACDNAEEVRANLAAVLEHGAKAERARIRRELLEAIQGECAVAPDYRNLLVSKPDLLAALDRICPREED